MPTITDIENLIRQKCIADMGTMFSEEKFESMLTPYIAGIEKRMNDKAFAKGFMERCPYPNTTLKDYFAQFITLQDGAWALVSLRFIGMDPNVPFILIEYCSQELTSKNLSPILDQVAKHYGHLQLEKYGFATTDLLRKMDGWNLQVDKIHVRNTIPELMDAPDDFDFIKLVPTPSITTKEYSQYEKEYQVYLNANPVLKGQLFYETLDFLNQLGAQGNMLMIYIAGEYAGIVAATELFEQYFYGWGMMEEFLFKAHRGKGYGKIIQQKLLQELAIRGHAGEYLFGSIAWDNFRSLRTAAANGRLPFMYSYFATKWIYETDFL